MISFMKSWCEGIIVAVMISIIIELLIPEGNNKKYVKVVTGIFILFVILNPILEKTKDVKIFDEFSKINTVEASIDINDSIKQVYIDGLENTIKENLSQEGYLIKDVKLTVDNQYENIEKMEVSLKDNKTEDIKLEIKEYLSERYQVLIENVYIK